MDKIAVLVPCYNEGKTIEKVVTDFKRVLPEAVIYVYDKILQTELPKSQRKPVQLSVMNITREKAM